MACGESARVFENGRRARSSSASLSGDDVSSARSGAAFPFVLFASDASGFALDDWVSTRGGEEVATGAVDVDTAAVELGAGVTTADAAVEVVGAGAATGGMDTGCTFGASPPAAGATEGAGMPMSVVLFDCERGAMLEAPGGLDVSGRGGDEATGRGAKELGAERSGLEGRGGLDEGGRGGLELDAGRGGVLTALLGGVLGGLAAPVCADGDGALLAGSRGVVLGRASGTLLDRSRGVVLGRAGGVVLARGAAGSSPQASSTSSSFSLIPWRL